jgi:hypothetical protein
MLGAQGSKRWNVAMGAAFALTALVAVVAVASRAPLDGSQPVNASSARTPLSALFVLGAGAGLVALCAMALCMWPQRRRRDDEPERARPPLQVHWAWKVAAILVPLVLGATLVAAAVLGVQASAGFGRLDLASRMRHAVAPFVSERGASSFAVPSWLPWTALGILAVAVALGVWLVRRRSPMPNAATPSRPATRAAVEAAIVALDATRNPRDAVIAAYAAMERSFAAQNLGRLAPEAPREYLRRVLSTSAAPMQPAATITGLFEEARFSTHPMTENDRGCTLAALRALRANLEGQR